MFWKFWNLDTNRDIGSDPNRLWWIGFWKRPEHLVLWTSPIAPSGKATLSPVSTVTPPFPCRCSLHSRIAVVVVVVLLLSICREIPDEVYRNLEGIGGNDDKWWEVLYMPVSAWFGSIIRVMEIDAIWTKLWNKIKLNGMKCEMPSVFYMWFLQAAELQKLILAHNSIESLKEDIRNLPFLTVLNLSHNSLSQLPAAIGEWVSVSVFFIKS